MDKYLGDPGAIGFDCLNFVIYSTRIDYITGIHASNISGPYNKAKAKTRHTPLIKTVMIMKPIEERHQLRGATPLRRPGDSLAKVFRVKEDKAISISFYDHDGLSGTYAADLVVFVDFVLPGLAARSSMY